MTRKSQLAEDLGVPYTTFRQQLREMEKKDLKFNTGRRQLLTETEANSIRAHFKNLATLAL